MVYDLCYKMSVIRPSVIQCFVAPIAISATNASVTGSWHRVCVDQDLRMSAERLCHYRVQCWKQHIGPSIVDTCLDFCVVKHAENIKMHVELSFATHHDCQSVLDETTKTVQILVKDPICIGIARLFQQAQPGEGTEGS